MVTPGDPVCFQPASKHWRSETWWPLGPPYVALVQGEWIARTVETARRGLVAVAWPDARRFLSPEPLCCSERPSLASGPCHPHSPASTGFFFFFLPSRSVITQVLSVPRLAGNAFSFISCTEVAFISERERGTWVVPVVSGSDRQS